MNERSYLEKRPEEGHCAPEHLSYVARVPDGNILDVLRGQSETFRGLFSGLSDADASFRYAPGKWSVKELVGHLCDSERVFGYRALCIARCDRGPFPPFDENRYVESARFDARSFADLTTEFGLIRKLTYSFFSSLNEEEWSRTGIANDHEYSVRALAFVTAGHLMHHMEVFQERYLPGIGRSSPASQ